MITIWDVGHGLSTWIQTPNGHNHWVDTGFLSDPRFSPSEHVYQYYGVRQIDYLTISHADKDHFDDLDNFIRCFGAPRVFHRNKSVPFDEKYGTLSAGYQKALHSLDQSHIHPVSASMQPRDPAWNGGVTIKQFHLDWSEAGNINDSSIVTFYAFQRWLFILPGDIGPGAWDKLWTKHCATIAQLTQDFPNRILVAPHHGRASGYSESMINALQPHLIVVSDEYGKEPTDSRFRTKGLGLEYNASSLGLRRIPEIERLFEPMKTGFLGLLDPRRDLCYLTMKKTGRLQFAVSFTGECKLHIFQE